MLKQSGTSPSLIAMGSVAGPLGGAFRAAHASTRWAIVGLVRSLARELGPMASASTRSCPGALEGERMRP